MDRRDFLKTGVAATAAVSLPGYARAQSAEQVLRIAMTLSDIPATSGQPTQGAEGIRFIGITVYDALFRWDLSRSDVPSRLIPSLAESYSVDPATQTEWTFKLRSGVRFHDGSDFTADSVIWNLDKLLKADAPQYDPAQVSAGGSSLAGIASYRKIDDMTVAISTATPDALFFYRIANINMSSPAHWEALDGDWAAFASQPSGTGPWKLDRLVPRERAELVRNDAYWDANRVPKLDRVVLFAMPDASTRAAALLAGQVDWVEAPPADIVPRLTQAGMQIITNVYPHVWPYQLSYGADSPFKDIRVRKAANLAIDRDALCLFLGGLAKPAKGQVDTASPWFGKPTFDITYDPDAASALLAEAGFGPDNPCRIKLLTSQSGSGQMQPVPMNEFIQENLQQVGFEVEIEVVDWEAIRAHLVASADADVNKGIHGVNSSWAVQDPDFAFLTVTASDREPPNGFNWGLYSDSTADELCGKIRLAFEPEAMDAAVAELHQYLVDQAKWIWVVHDLNPRGLAPNVQGFVPPQNWYVDLTTISLA